MLVIISPYSPCLRSFPSLGQHSEGVILSERGAEVSSAYPIEALGSTQNVDEVGGVAGAFIPQSSDRPNASYAALKDTAPHAPKVVL